MDIFGGIDGTGPYSDEKYQTGFENSNVKKLSRLPWPGGRFYDRGPGADGFSTGFRADEMAAKVARAYRDAAGNSGSSPSRVASQLPRIFLSGYSRGGAAVANVAHTLNDQGIPVHCLLLFDAVDRSATIWRSSVPANVRFCFHAKRSPRSGSRTSFGNCSTTAHGNVRLVSCEFMCTHGAMGGMPWEAEADGFIHERELPTSAPGTLSLGNFARAAASAAATALTGNPQAGDAAANLYDSVSKTNITDAQEQAGVLAVWGWMNSNLNLAKVVAGG